MSIKVFAGEDSFRSRMAYLVAREEARKRIGVVVLRDENLTEESLSNSLGGQTLFGNSPAIVLEGITSFTGKRADDFVEILSRGKTAEIIIWENGKPNAQLKVWKYLQKNAEYFKIFGLPTDFEVRNFIAEKVRSLGAKINNAAVTSLINVFHGDLASINNELEKLALFSLGREISAEDVKEVSAVETKVNVFNVARSLALGDYKSALKNLADSRAVGEEPRFILSQVIKDVRALLAIRDMLDRRQNVRSAELAAQVGTRDFVIDALSRSAARMSAAKLRRLFDQLVVSTYALNTGRAEADDILDNIALQSVG
jgi:DNA polymerase III delta subunit